MVGYCYICKIGQGEKDNVSIHRLPTNEKTKAKWFAFMGYETGPNSGICSRHFQESDFVYKVHGDNVRRFLKPGACPSLLQYIELSSDKKNAKTFHEQSTNDCTNINDCVNTSDCTNANDNISDEDHDNKNDILNNVKTERIDSEDVSFEFIKIESITTDEEPPPMVQIPLKSFDKLDSSQTRKIGNRKRRYCAPKHIGDICREDFNSEQCWTIFHKYLVETKEKLKYLKQEITCLNNKATKLQVIIDHCKDKGIICSDDRNCHIDNDEGKKEV